MATSPALRRQFINAAASMALVRRFVEEAAAGHPCLESAVLVADEIASNAFRHTASPELDVGVHAAAGTLTVTVGASPVTASEPRVRPEAVRGDGEGGRGLFIVDALCREWGVYFTGGRQVVYATMETAEGLLAEAAPGAA